MGKACKSATNFCNCNNNGNSNYNSAGNGNNYVRPRLKWHPTPLDNYICNVAGCRFFARYMDDFYIIHQDKKFLKNLLAEIKKIADNLELKLNQKKTQIYRIDKGFTFLKQRILLTNSGKVIRKPVKNNIVRERRKLKRFKIKLENGEMSLDSIKQQYKSWRGAIKKYNSYHALQNMDKLFHDLFTDS